MEFLSLDDLELANKRVLVRVDFNVPLTDDGEVANDKRIRAALPTIRTILERDAKQVVLCSHLGKPKGKVVDSLRMDPVAICLGNLLGIAVAKVHDCIAVDIPDDRIIMLENLRFHAEEKGNDDAFAAKLAAYGDVYVNDAFGTCHRAHASVDAVARLLPAAAGLLVHKELDVMGAALAAPDRPFVAIMGGVKVSDKIEVIRNLLGKVDRILIGGAMMYTFLRAQGKATGRSLVEEDKLDLARELLTDPKITIPVDTTVAVDMEPEAAARAVDVDSIGETDIGLDIGPRTMELYESIIADARTVVWNGPMGRFEWEQFANGTRSVARAVADSEAVSIIGGGDSASAIESMGFADDVTHVSTGGGASMSFLEGRILPGIAALEESARQMKSC